MPRKPKAISKNKIPEIAESLKAKAKTPITVTIEELVRSLAQPIQEMLDAGYSYEDVAAVFAEHGVELAASGIKSYHKKSTSTQSKSAPSEETQSSPEPSPLSASSEETQLQPEMPSSDLHEPEEPNDLPKTKVSAKSKFNITDRRKI
jgi:hypothetical protein